MEIKLSESELEYIIQELGGLKRIPQMEKAPWELSYTYEDGLIDPSWLDICEKGKKIRASTTDSFRVIPFLRIHDLHLASAHRVLERAGYVVLYAVGSWQLVPLASWDENLMQYDQGSWMGLDFKHREFPEIAHNLAIVTLYGNPFREDSEVGIGRENIKRGLELLDEE